MFKRKDNFDSSKFANARVEEELYKTNRERNKLIEQVKRVRAAQEAIDLWDSEAMKKKALETFRQEKKLLLCYAGAYDGALVALKDMYEREKDKMSYTLHYDFEEWSDEIVFKALLDRM